jgi:hypothetical protein
MKPPRLHPISAGVTSEQGRTLAELRQREADTPTYQPAVTYTGATFTARLRELAAQGLR